MKKEYNVSKRRAMKMEIINKSVDDLIPYDNNPRKNEDSVDYVASSIKEFGFKVPIIVDKDNVIVTGHTRLKAAKRLGLEEVPCIMADDLSDEQIKAFRLADNKVGEFSEWDEGLLELELMDIDNLNLADFGFDLGDFEIEEEKKEEREKTIRAMKLKQFEHYDYLVFVFDNQLDWLNAVTLFDIKQVDAGYGKQKKIGIGRVLEGKELFEKINKEVE